MTRVVVHIDRLVLRGVRHEDRHAVASALRVELSRILAVPGAAAAVDRCMPVNSTSIYLTAPMVADGLPAALGAATAQAIGARWTGRLSSRRGGPAK